MKVVKRLAIAAALVVVAIAGVLVVIASTLDLNAYCDDIAAEAERATGRALSIRGDIDAHLLSLRPALVAHDVGLANAPWGSRPEMARLGRLELQLDLLALLRGEVAVDRLVLEAPDVLLETDASGHGNWVFAQTGGAGQETGAAPLPTFGEMRIDGARVAYRDGRTGREIAATLGRLTLRAPSAAGPMEIQAAGAVAGHDVIVTGTLGPLADLLAGRAYPVDFSARLGSSDIAGRLELALAAAPPAINGALTAERLDVSEIAAAFGAGAAATSENGTDARLFDDEPLPFEALATIDTDMAVAIARLDLDGLRIADFDGTLTLAGGRLTLAPFAASVAGGTVRGEATVDARQSPPSVAARVEARDLALAELGAAIRGGVPVTAPVNADLRLAGIGTTPHAIAASLDGRATIVAGRGRVDDALFGSLSADLLKAVTPWAPREQGLGVVCVIGDFAIAGGVARRRVLLADTTRAALVGRRGGQIDLGQERMDLLFDPYTKGLSVATVVAAPIRVQGPIVAPNVVPDPGAALEGVAMAPFNLAGKAADGVLGAIGGVAGAVGSVVGFGGDGQSEAPAGPCPEALAAVAAMAEWPGKGAAAAAPSGGVTGTVSGVGKAAGEAVEGVGRGVGKVLEGVGEGLGNIFKK